MRGEVERGFGMSGDGGGEDHADEAEVTRDKGVRSATLQVDIQGTCSREEVQNEMR